MRICYITPDLGLPSETFVRNNIGRIKSLGYDVELFCNSVSNGYYDLPDVKYSNINFLRIGNPFYRLLYKFIFGQHRKTYLLQREVSRNIRKALKTISFDLLFIDYGTTAALMLPFLKHISKRIIIHFHGNDLSGSLQNKVYRESLFELTKIDTVISLVPSNHLRRRLIIQGADESRIIVNPYEVRVSSMGSSKKTEARLVFIGRLTPKKTPLALIEVCRILRKKGLHFFFDIVGDGELFEEVKDRIDRYSLGSIVVLHGALSHEKAMNLLGNSYCYIQHSVTNYDGDQEGYPNSILEAMTLGIPVVSTYHSGISEQIIHKENGFLVQEFDFEAMANYVEKILREPDLRNRLGNQSIKILKDRDIENLRIRNFHHAFSSG